VSRRSKLLSVPVAFPGNHKGEREREREREREKKGKTGWEQASKTKQLPFLLSLPTAPLAATHLPLIKLGRGRSSRKRWQQPIWEGSEE
jgi:hypothetical protein